MQSIFSGSFHTYDGAHHPQWNWEILSDADDTVQKFELYCGVHNYWAEVHNWLKFQATFKNCTRLKYFCKKCI